MGSPLPVPFGARSRASEHLPAGLIVTGPLPELVIRTLRSCSRRMDDPRAVRAAFDRVGGSIERVAGANPVNAWMRGACRAACLAEFPQGSRLIEIGCGAGADATFLAERGYRILALDVAPAMVEATRERARDAALQGSIEVREGRVTDLEPGNGDGAPWDGAYANFSLTYEPDLRPVAEKVHALLRPGGRFLFTLPNKACLSEALLLLGRGRGDEAAARWREPRWGTVRGIRVPSRAYMVAEVAAILRGHFDLRSVRGLPVFLPPPRMYGPRLEPLRPLLERVDRGLSRRSPWNRLGESTLFVTARTDLRANA